MPVFQNILYWNICIMKDLFSKHYTSTRPRKRSFLFLGGEKKSSAWGYLPADILHMTTLIQVSAQHHCANEITKWVLSSDSQLIP